MFSTLKTLKSIRNLISLIGKGVFRHCREELLTRKDKAHLPLKVLVVAICVLFRHSRVMYMFSAAAYVKKKKKKFLDTFLPVMLSCCSAKAVGGESNPVGFAAEAVCADMLLWQPALIPVMM